MSSAKKNSSDSLQELLRWKRHEQPEESFWEQFDRDLKERTLASVVERSPWYLSMWKVSWSRLFWLTPATCLFIFFFSTDIFRPSAPEKEVAILENVEGTQVVAESSEPAFSVLSYGSEKFGTSSINTTQSEKSYSENFAYASMQHVAVADASVGFAQVNVNRASLQTGKLFF